MRFDPMRQCFVFACLVFWGLVYCSNHDVKLWSSALMESVIIPSGQSVWHSAVTFQSPPFSPLVRHISLPPPLVKV